MHIALHSALQPRAHSGTTMHSATSMSHVGHGPGGGHIGGMAHGPGHGPLGGGGGSGKGGRGVLHSMHGMFGGPLFGSGQLAGSSSSIPNMSKRMHKGGLSGFGGGDK